MYDIERDRDSGRERGGDRERDVGGYDRRVGGGSGRDRDRERERERSPVERRRSRSRSRERGGERWEG